MLKKFLNKLSLGALLFFLFPFRYMPIPWLHKCGKGIGYLAYIFHSSFRKRSYSNLSLAKSLSLSFEDIQKITLESLQSLAITSLEYAKLSTIKDLGKLVTCHYHPEVEKLLQKGNQIVFFCSHQANWELLFIEAHYRGMQGIAIGKPIKNPYLYRWIISIRERFGGKIIEPKNAIKEGLRALKQNKFVGIVGDQAMPSSFFSSDFLGRKAYTSPLPALLAYRTGHPIVFAEILRRGFHYHIHYHEPVYPNKETPQEQDISRMMNHILGQLEASILQNPGQWLWAHNRWKQEEADLVYYRFRYESIAVVVDEKNQIESTQNFLFELRKIYPRAFIDLICPEASHLEHIGGQTYYYANSPHEIISPYRYKLIFNISSCNLSSLKKLGSVFKILSPLKLAKLAKKQSSLVDENNLQEILIKAISRKNTYWKEEA